MTTLTSKPVISFTTPENTGRITRVQPPARLSDAEIQVRLERASLRTVASIVVGVTLVAFILAVVFLGWELAVIGTVGIGLTALLFGSPFWIAAVDAEVEREHARLTGSSTH